MAEPLHVVLASRPQTRMPWFMLALMPCQLVSAPSTIAYTLALDPFDAIAMDSADSDEPLLLGAQKIKSETGPTAGQWLPDTCVRDSGLWLRL